MKRQRGNFYMLQVGGRGVKEHQPLTRWPASLVCADHYHLTMHHYTPQMVFLNRSRGRMGQRPYFGGGFPPESSSGLLWKPCWIWLSNPAPAHVSHINTHNRRCSLVVDEWVHWLHFWSWCSKLPQHVKFETNYTWILFCPLEQWLSKSDPGTPRGPGVGPIWSHAKRGLIYFHFNSIHNQHNNRMYDFFNHGVHTVSVKAKIFIRWFVV